LLLIKSAYGQNTPNRTTNLNNIWRALCPETSKGNGGKEGEKEKGGRGGTDFGPVRKSRIRHCIKPFILESDESITSMINKTFQQHRPNTKLETRT